MKYLLLDGCPCPKPLFPLLKKLKEETGCTYNSIYRGDDVAGLLHKEGKHTQRELYEMFLRGEGAPANPPDRGTHILLGDGVVGALHAKLPFWRCGIDVDDADVPKVIAAAARHGWKLYQPYPSSLEYHHLNFAKRPSRWKAFFHHVFGPAKKKKRPPHHPLPPVPKPPVPSPHHKKHTKVDVLGTAIDVSEAQGDVDWPKVAKKGVRKGLRKRAVKVGICKATEGADWTDSRFSGARLKAIAKAGLAVGVYHFARPDNNSAVTEARHFVRAVKAAGGHFISFEEWREGRSGVFGFLDFETSPYDKKFAIEFAAEFKKLTGCDLGIYGGGYSLNPVLAALKHFACVWLAAYVAEWEPYFDGPSSSVKFWQNKDNWRCPGVSGDVDHSVYLG